MEDPQALAGLHVEAAHVAFDISLAGGDAAGLVRRAHDHHVLGDHWSGVQADFAIERIDDLVVVGFEVDDAVFTEGRDAITGFRVQCDESVAGGHIEDSLFGSVGPVGQAASGKLARGDGAAASFIFAVDPQQLAGGGIERDHSAARAGGGIDHALGHQGRAFHVELGAGAEVLGLESPGHLELVEIVAVNLIER